jgi:hypothetical protein
MKGAKCEVCGSDHKVEKFHNEIFLCIKHYKQMYRHGKILNRTTRDANQVITYDDYSEILLYDKHGNEIGRTKVSNDKIEAVTKHKWHLDNGYVCSINKGVITLLHRMITNAKTGEVVDHVSHDILDNRNDNLRVCTQQQNSFNTSLKKNNSSGFPGVSFRKDRGKWRSFIMVNRKQIHLGSYLRIEDAIKSRKEAEERYFGDFAYKESIR